MAATFVNLGFETANVLQGVAQGWEFVHVATAELFAEYGPRVPGTGFEDYNTGWGNDVFDTELIVTSPSQFAFYDTAPQDREDYEQEWGSNEFWATELSGIEEASYDTGTPQLFEDYEEEWDSNETFKFAFVGVGTDLEEASYDSTTPETAEDYEEEWAFNQLFQTTFSSFQGAITIFSATDQIERDDAGSWITEQGFAHLNNGDGAVELVNTVSNNGVHPITGIVGATNDRLQSSDALINDAAPTIIVRDHEIAQYDASSLIIEGYEGTWTPMTTL